MKKEKKKIQKQYNICLQQNQNYHTMEMINLRRACSILTKDDIELSNGIFRGFHTVKGGAGFLGLNNLVDVLYITHGDVGEYGETYWPEATRNAYIELRYQF